MPFAASSRHLRGLCGSSSSLLSLALIAHSSSPHPAHAYAGPGAGFAVLSSFWALFVAFLYSLYAHVDMAHPPIVPHAQNAAMPMAKPSSSAPSSSASTAWTPNSPSVS